MQTENYKKRAVDVRRSARANLIEIRKARMARKSAISAENVREVASFEENGAANGIELPEDMIAPAAKQPVETDTVIDEMTSPEAVMDVPEEKLDDSAGMDRLDELATKNAAVADMEAPIAPVEKLPEVETTAVDDTPENTQQDWKSSDLAKLPGAGPGLIWMLEQCDIDNLATLAQQEPTDLATRLGVVGQILDVGQWIAYAQENG